MKMQTQGEIRPKHIEAAAAVGATVLCAGLLLLAFLLAGCARVRPNAAHPGRPGTPIENALAYNAALAEANKTVAQTVIDAANANPPLISVESANKILIMQSKVADADRQLTPLLSDVGNLHAHAAAIEKLLDDIKGAAGQLVSSGDLGIKDASAQKRIGGAVSNIYNLADVIFNTLKAGGLLK